MRKTALLLGVFCFVALASAARADQTDHEWSKSWTVSASTEFHLIADRGSIHVTQVAGNSIRAVVTTEGWRIDSSEVSISDTQTPFASICASVRRKKTIPSSTGTPTKSRSISRSLLARTSIFNRLRRFRRRLFAGPDAR